MNCKDMMRIPELENVLKLKAGERGLEHLVRWIYFADCLQCIKSEYKMENYIHGGEFVILTNRSVTDDSEKLMTMIGQMYEHGIAALGINEGQISDKLTQYCEEKSLPLFELPEKYPLIDFSQIMCRRLVLEENERNAAEQLFSSILDAEHLSRDRVMAQARYLNINLEGSFCVAEVAFENAKSGWENDDSLTLGQNIKRMINTEFFFIRKKIFWFCRRPALFWYLFLYHSLMKDRYGIFLHGSLNVYSESRERICVLELETVRRIWMR